MSFVRHDDTPATAIGVLLGVLLFIAYSMCSAGCGPSLIRKAAAIPHGKATYEPSVGDDRIWALNDLFARAASWGFAVIPMPADDPAYGRVHARGRIIWVRDDLSVNAKAEVMAHEMGHIFQPYGLDTSEAEVFAELVLDQVAKGYGFNVEDISAPYLAAHKAGFPIARFMALDIRLASEVILGRRAVVFADEGSGALEIRFGPTRRPH